MCRRRWAYDTSPVVRARVECEMGVISMGLISCLEVVGAIVTVVRPWEVLSMANWTIFSDSDSNRIER